MKPPVDRITIVVEKQSMIYTQGDTWKQEVALILDSIKKAATGMPNHYFALRSVTFEPGVDP